MESKKNNMGNIKCRNLIEKELECIGNYFINRSDFFPYIGMYGGETGTVLLLAQFYLKTRDEKYLFKLREYLDKIIDLCNGYPDISISPYYSNGLAGFGWLLCYLKENDLVDFEDDYLAVIDDILKNDLKNNNTMSWDMLHGRLGIVRYFFKRKNIEMIENELEIMREKADIINGEYKWLSTTFSGKISYDTGLAHGMAGILYFIGKSYEMGIKKELCLELGDGILQFYRHIQQDFSQIGSFYPSFIPAGFYYEDYNNSKSRLAWCYGDLGILYSIYLYYMRTGRQSDSKDVLEKLLLTADRKHCSSNEVYDAMLCHGSSGLVQIYNRLYILSGDKKFRNAFHYWLEVSVKIGREPTYNPPYKFVTSQEKGENGVRKLIWSESLSMLEGVVGVGLAFLSALDYEHINWDEVLMLY